jgi:hypothetical protein
MLYHILLSYRYIYFFLSWSQPGYLVYVFSLIVLVQLVSKIICILLTYSILLIIKFCYLQFFFLVCFVTCTPRTLPRFAWYNVGGVQYFCAYDSWKYGKQLLPCSVSERLTGVTITSSRFYTTWFCVSEIHYIMNICIWSRYQIKERCTLK